MLKQAYRRCRGFSLVELMVGMAIGLVVVLGAMSMVVQIQTGSWNLQVETRLNQDLRAAADVIARDLRRGGYWGDAIRGTQTVGGTSTTPQNPYAAVSGSTSAGLAYGFSRDAVENNVLDAGEQFGFRLSSGMLQMQTSNGVWQDLTDSKNLTITAFNITPSDTALPLGHLCAKGCAPGTPNCPTTRVRSYLIGLTGQSVRDSSVVRNMNISVRVRNDQLQGQCPI
jgi:type IV pilus assembly protein PilW